MIYLDANADRAPAPAALARYAEVGQRDFEDPAAEASRCLEKIRRALGLPEGRLVSTRGGTAADGWALKAALADGGHVVSTTLEHAAVADTLARLERCGACTVTRVVVSRAGRVEPEAVRSALQDDTRLISVIAASNETGVIQPVGELARIARASGVLLHVDAVQTVGRVQLALEGVDLATFSAHKLGGLTGLGFVWVRHGLAALADALEAAHPKVSSADYDLPGLHAVLAALESEAKPMNDAGRDRLERALLELGGVEIIGAEHARLPNTTLARLDGCEGDGLMMALDMEGVAVSTGSACASGSIEPSPILLGMGFSAAEARQTVRFSLPPELDDEALDQAIARVREAVRRMRALAALDDLSEESP